MSFLKSYVLSMIIFNLFKVYAKVYAVLNQINIDPLNLFNDKGRSVTRSLINNLYLMGIITGVCFLVSALVSALRIKKR